MNRPHRAVEGHEISLFVSDGILLQTSLKRDEPKVTPSGVWNVVDRSAACDGKYDSRPTTRHRQPGRPVPDGRPAWPRRQC